jgi:hypothetical protein
MRWPRPLQSLVDDGDARARTEEDWSLWPASTRVTSGCRRGEVSARHHLRLFLDLGYALDEPRRERRVGGTLDVATDDMVRS